MGRPRAPEGGTLRAILARAIGFTVTGPGTEDAAIRDDDGNIVLNGYEHPLLDHDAVARNAEAALRDGDGRLAIVAAVWLRSGVGLETVGPSGRPRRRLMTEAEVLKLLSQKGHTAFAHPEVLKEAVPYICELEEIQRLRNSGVARHRWEDMLDELLKKLKLPRSRSTRERRHK